MIAMADQIPIKFALNGKEVEARVKPNASLLNLLRRELRVTSVKRGCDRGECGVCTVLIDDKPVKSCLVLAAQADGKAITTIEGIGGDGQLHRIQEAFVQTGAVQCGFCTPAMILTIRALLGVNPTPSREEVKAAISGVLCRCTGYSKIVEAAELASAKRTR